ncbi:MAG: Rieske (2Fe-2S) protein [Candidatus Tectomicrobia bacterium]|nr:Rieske (2Fe-2S) protein [Candidatus Tectomicrobia bacterium]
MSKHLHICAMHELPSGTRRVVEIGDYDEVLVLNVDGAIYAINNVCPHAGAALERGASKDGVLYCPLHHWGFRLCNGTAIDATGYCARTYRVITCGDDLVLCLP